MRKITIYNAPDTYSIPAFLLKTLKVLGYFRKKSAKDPTQAEINNDERMTNILHTFEISEKTDMVKLGCIFAPDMRLIFKDLNDENGKEGIATYGCIHPLHLVFHWYTALPANKANPDITNLSEYHNQIMDGRPSRNITDATVSTTNSTTKYEPKIHVVDLPPCPSQPSDWFAWRYEIEIAMDASGGGKYLTDLDYDTKYPEGSRKVKAMLVKAVAMSDGYELSRFILPDDVHEQNSGYHIWQSMLETFQNGPTLEHHLEVVNAKITNLKCGEGLGPYIKFVKDLLAYKQQYTALRKTANEKNAPFAGAYIDINWVHKFKEKSKRSSTVNNALNDCTTEEVDTFRKTIMAVMVKMRERHIVTNKTQVNHDKQPKQKQYPAKAAIGKEGDRKAPHTGTPSRETLDSHLRNRLYKDLKACDDDAAKAVIKGMIDKLSSAKKFNKDANSRKRSRGRGNGGKGNYEDSGANDDDPAEGIGKRRKATKSARKGKPDHDESDDGTYPNEQYAAMFHDSS